MSTEEQPDGAIENEADDAAEAASDVSVDLPVLEALLFSTHHPLTAGRLAELMATRPAGTVDVFAFYSGHGAPAGRPSKKYLVPVDANAAPKSTSDHHSRRAAWLTLDEIRDGRRLRGDEVLDVITAVAWGNATMHPLGLLVEEARPWSTSQG